MRNMEILLVEYVSKQVEYLAKKSMCCFHWFGPYYSMQHIFIHRLAYFGLSYKVHIINGHTVTKIYKPNCNHIVHQPSCFQLTKKSLKDILHHFKEFDTLYQPDTLILPQTLRPSRSKPVLPPNRFTIGPHIKSIFHPNTDSTQLLHHHWRIFPFKQEIMQKICDNRILVINGDVSLEKSTAIPMFIVEDSTTTETYCKILCVESDTLTAIAHCTELAKNMKERIGGRTGFQVYLQSRVCDNTNLIYTTAIFFLRVLMGQNYKDSFRHITHIVVSDVHLHHAYSDMLLHELRNILPYYPEIKIILLSDSVKNDKLLSYYGEGEELRLEIDLHDVKLHYIEEINRIIENDQDRRGSSQIVDDILTTVTFNPNINEEKADKALEEYESTGSEHSLKRFLYIVNGENVSIDCTHSKLGYTALISAARHGRCLHLTHLLISENANPFIQDKYKFTALEYAISNDHIDCAKVLMHFMKENVYVYKQPPIDFLLIKKLVQLLTTICNFGHILIFLPTYEDLLKLNFGILKLKFMGRIPQEVSIYMLHPEVQNDQLQQIITDDSDFVKIILATKMAESFAYLNDITYVIDTGLNCIEKYHPESKCTEYITEWASQETLQRRSVIASRFTAGHCFRLIPRNLFSKLTPLSPPELLYMPLNRVSLTAKFLCPDKKLLEYFQQTIVKPPLKHVLHSIEFLKKIEVFDNMEDVTWLGCRLLDVPIDLELGKSLALSVILKCLDPVLTIISFLTCANRREIERCKSSVAVENIFDKREQVFPEDSYSDHLTLLRLYQLWQNKKRENTMNDILSNEDTFVINGILDKVCGKRTFLVGALRSSQLIHNQGQLSMNLINTKSHNWAVIKAALAGGLYPKLCMVDRNENQLKSTSRKLSVHPSSTLRNSQRMQVNPVWQDYPSDWIMFFNETDSGIMNSISDCTLISPVTVALFAGKTKLCPENILFAKNIDQSSSSGYANLYVDEWIWLTTDTISGLLLYKLRQRLQNAYFNFLQTCGNSEKWKRENNNEMSSLFDLISKILFEEDMRSGFPQPYRVGNRPKAVANKHTSDFDIRRTNLRRRVDVTLSRQLPYRCLDKEFFLINIFDSHKLIKSFQKLSIIDISRKSLFDSVRLSASLEKLTYVVVCNLNRKQLTNIAIVKCNGGEYFLRNCFQINIPVCEVIIMCLNYKITSSLFKPHQDPIRLDNSIGETILNLL